MTATDSYSLMLHGGAGALDDVDDNAVADRYLDSVRRTLEHGRELLRLGGSALQAVEACASLLEDDPVFNAGRGSVLNENGKVEMDAAIMDGRDLSAGAVAGVANVAHPVGLARLVMTESEHVMLVSEGAMRFAAQCGVPLMPDDYFLSSERVEQLEQARLRHRMILDHDDPDEHGDDQKHGTIGAIARDRLGNLAAVTSTGGMVNKRMGRVGDSPIIGAGVYADNETCAVSATGYGEEFMRTVIAKTISDFIFMKGMDAGEATRAGIAYLRRRVRGRGGVIVIDRDGACAAGFTTRRMIHGWIENGGEAVARF
ncbi:MAG: isoaspartyl peptidase/L-asparaginase family protein [Sedimenticolaceae bacterium]|jgi:beta-aspartyl-peptidase (threonine type)